MRQEFPMPNEESSLEVYVSNLHSESKVRVKIHEWESETEKSSRVIVEGRETSKGRTRTCLSVLKS